MADRSTPLHTLAARLMSCVGKEPPRIRHPQTRHHIHIRTHSKPNALVYTMHTTHIHIQGLGSAPAKSESEDATRTHCCGGSRPLADRDVL